MDQYVIGEVPALPHWLHGRAFVGCSRRFVGVVDRVSGKVVRQIAAAGADEIDEAKTSCRQALALPWTAKARRAWLSHEIPALGERLIGLRLQTHFLRLLVAEASLGDELCAVPPDSDQSPPVQTPQSAPTTEQMRPHWQRFAAAHTNPELLLPLVRDDEVSTVCQLVIRPERLLADLWRLIAALASGQVVLVTPLAASPSVPIAYAELLSQHGCPPGRCNVLLGDDASLAQLALSAADLVPPRVGQEPVSINHC